MCDCLVGIDMNFDPVRDYLILCGKPMWPFSFSILGGFTGLSGVEICGWGEVFWT